MKRPLVGTLKKGSWYCPTHNMGFIDEYRTHKMVSGDGKGNCEYCGQSLVQDAEETIQRECNLCGFEVDIPWHDWEKTIFCTQQDCAGVFVPPAPRQAIGGFSINGIFTGSGVTADVGRKIEEKNRQLKKKHSGYSYEERNLRRDIEQKVKERTS